MSLVDPATVERYVARGWWGTTTLEQRVRHHAATRPAATAYTTGDDRATWAELDATADAVAAALARAGLAPGDRAGVLLDDGPLIHAAYLGAERAGVVVVGLGTRAGDAELSHLLARTGARALLGTTEHHGTALADRAARLGREDLSLLALDAGLPPATDGDRAALAGRAVGPNDLFLLNSTSGTTGMPKIVTQFQNRWVYFHQLATRNAELTEADVFLSAVPTPFGFGLWTSHATPILLGAPTVVLPRFDAGRALRLAAGERVTVMAAVSTQFLLMLASDELDHLDLSCLRVLFTGGEAVPEARAKEFEERTGAAVLQFFGSNETGAFSGTALSDPPHRRLTTAGRVIPEMAVRLFDDEGADVTATGGPGQPGGIGPATCAGYWDDDEANAQLYAADGSMLMADYVTIDDEGYLTVVGRKSDLIIRGGKNLSAPSIEAEVATHPAVRLAAAIAAPDYVFGERVLAVVELVPGAELDLGALHRHLLDRGAGKELLPEYLVAVEALPIASGGKVAKGQLRDRVEELLAGAEVAPSVPR